MKLIEIEYFITLCRCGQIIERDGRGYYANADMDYISPYEVLPLDATKDDFERRGFTHVAWYPSSETAITLEWLQG